MEPRRKKTASLTGGGFTERLTDSEGASRAGPQKAPEKELAKIAKGAGITYLGKIIGSGLQYVYVIVIARVLGVESFGLFVLGLTIINFAELMSRLGLDSGIVRYVAIFNGTGDKEKVKGTILAAFKLSFMASVCFLFILIFSAETVIAPLLGKPELGGVIKVLAVSLPFSTIMTMSLFSTQGFQVMRYTVYAQNLFWPLVNLALVGALCLAGLRVYGVASAYVVSVMAASALSFHFLRKTFFEMPGIESKAQTWELVRFSLPLTFVTLFNFLILWTDTLMLGYFRPAHDVGVYNAAMKTSLLTTIILASFNSIFSPIISDLYNRNETVKLHALFRSVTRWIYTLSLPAFLLIVLLPRDVMSLFGQEFAPGWAPLVILAAAQLVNAGSGSVGYMLMMSGRQDIVFYNAVSVCVLNIALNYALIPSYGIIGASLASGISIVALNLVMLLEVYVFLKMQPYDMKYLKPTAWGLLIFTVSALIGARLGDVTGPPRILLLGSVFVAGYVSGLYFWFMNDDDKMVLDAISRKIRGNRKVATQVNK